MSRFIVPFSRRGLLSLVVIVVSVLGARADELPGAFQNHLVALERRYGGRIGLASLDSADGKGLEYRGAERFALCSTFKFLLVAGILARVDAKQETLDHRISFGAADIVINSPISEAHLKDGGMTIEALCAAAMEYGDNTAANLLLKIVGGPPGVTAYIRSLGDSVGRVDRGEPTNNENRPNDVRDTTSPVAMLKTMRKILTGNVLSRSSCKLLETFLLSNTTGGSCLRAGVPMKWLVGDRTGRGLNGATNDIAIMWLPEQPPIFVVVFFSESNADQADREAVLAEVGRLVVAEFASEFPRATAVTTKGEEVSPARSLR